MAHSASTTDCKAVKVISWNGKYGSDPDTKKGFKYLQDEMVEALIEKYPTHYICLQEVEMTDKLLKKIQKFARIKYVYNKDQKVAIIWRWHENQDKCNNNKISIDDKKKDENHDEKKDEQNDVGHVRAEFDNFALICCHVPNKDKKDKKKEKILKFLKDYQHIYQKNAIVVGDFNLSSKEVRELPEIETVGLVHEPSSYKDGQREHSKKKVMMIQLKTVGFYSNELHDMHAEIILCRSILKITEDLTQTVFLEYEVLKYKATDQKNEIEKEIKEYKGKITEYKDAMCAAAHEEQQVRKEYKEAELKMKDSQDEYYMDRAKNNHGNEEKRIAFEQHQKRYTKAKNALTHSNEKHAVAVFKYQRMYALIDEAMGTHNDIKIEEEYTGDKYNRKIKHLFDILGHDPVCYTFSYRI